MPASASLRGIGDQPWPVKYAALVVIYVAIHYLFVSQSSQVLTLMGVFLDVGSRGGVPPALMAFALLFASSYFSVITPQGGSQKATFVGTAPEAGLRQRDRDLRRLRSYIEAHTVERHRGMGCGNLHHCDLASAHLSTAPPKPRFAVVVVPRGWLLPRCRPCLAWRVRTNSAG